MSFFFWVSADLEQLNYSQMLILFSQLLYCTFHHLSFYFLLFFMERKINSLVRIIVCQTASAHRGLAYHHIMKLYAYIKPQTLRISRAARHKLTVVSSSVADLQTCQVVKETLEIKGRQRRLKSWLSFVKPAKWKDQKAHHQQRIYASASEFQIKGRLNAVYVFRVGGFSQQSN